MISFFDDSFNLFTGFFNSFFYFTVVFSFANYVNSRWQNRNNYNESQNWQQIFIDTGDNISKVKPGKRYTNGPKKSANDVKKQKPFVLHIPHAGNNWSKGSDNWQKSGNGYCFAAVFFIKLLRADEIFFVKEDRVFFLEKFFADFMTEGIAYRIA